MAAEDEPGTVEDIDAEESDQVVEDLPDGGAIVTFKDKGPSTKQAEEFYANIAEELDQTVLESLATTLLEDIERDKTTRSKRVEQYEDALKRTGLGKEAPGGANFTGSSTVVHPILIEAVIDYSARAVQELIPPEGPVKMFIPGEDITKSRADKAKRKAALMNWQLKTQCKEFKPELEQALTQEGLAGVGYMRLVFDSVLKRPIFTFFAVDEVYLPYAASSFYTSERVTWYEDIVQQEFEKRMDEGLYITIVDASAPSMTPEVSKAEQANQKIEGKTAEPQNTDGLRRIFTTQVKVHFEDDKKNNSEGPVPYLINTDQTSRKIVSVVRNWEMEDKHHETMYWLIELPFIPWRGAYPIGLNQVMAGVPGALTGALRALLDSAHINNLPTLLKLKGSNTPGESQELNVTGVTEITGGVSGDDIRKLIMAVPYNPPSTVLFQLMGFLAEAGRGVVRTTFENLTDQNPDMPATLGLALIEQGMKVMSAIHLRQWTAMDNIINVLHRINRLYITDEEILDDTGTRLAFRSDFQGPLDCIPTADPQVFSDAQRFAQINVVAQRAAGNPLYDQRKVEELILTHTRIPNAKDLLVPKMEPQEMNAVNENAAMSLGRPVAAFPEQEHLAHLEVHLDFLQSPVFGFSRLFAPMLIQPMLEHVKQHMALWYVGDFHAQVTEAMDGEDLGHVIKKADTETRVELDKTLASASDNVINDASKLFAKYPEIIEKAMAILQQYSPPPPVDPTGNVAKAQIDAQVKREALQQKAQENAQKGQEKQMEVAAEGERSQADRMADAQRMAQEEEAETSRTRMREDSQNERSEREQETKEQINKEDNLTALTIAAADNEAGKRSEVSTGTGINPE